MILAGSIMVLIRNTCFNVPMSRYSRKKFQMNLNVQPSLIIIHSDTEAKFALSMENKLRTSKLPQRAKGTCCWWVLRLIQLTWVCRLGEQWDDRLHMRPLDVRHTSYYQTNWLKMVVLSIGDKAYKQIDEYSKSGTELYVTIRKSEVSSSKGYRSILLILSICIFLH